MNPETILYCSNEKREDEIRKNGVRVTSRIVDCECRDNPHDTEHTLFTITHEYEAGGTTVRKVLHFSFNLVHLAYANRGGLLNVPRLDLTPDDFIKAMGKGGTLDVITLSTPPHDYITFFNETAATVMQYEQMWM